MEYYFGVYINLSSIVISLRISCIIFKQNTTNSHSHIYFKSPRKKKIIIIQQLSASPLHSSKLKVRIAVLLIFKVKISAKMWSRFFRTDGLLCFRIYVHWIRDLKHLSWIRAEQFTFPQLFKTVRLLNENKLIKMTNTVK